MPDSTATMKARVCLVTGGTSGVGRAIARGLALRGASVVILSRSPEHGAATADALRRSTGNPDVTAETLNLASLDAIRGFAARFLRRHPALHVLSNNAAVLPIRREQTPDGFEKVFAVNYLGHFALTFLLLDLLKAGAPARILTVSGDPRHLRFSTWRPDALTGDAGIYHPLLATYRAAVAKVVFSHVLARRLEGTRVTSNTFHPGLVRSDLASQLPTPLRQSVILFERIFFSDACPTGIHLAASPAVETVTGRFFANQREVDFRPRFDLDAAGNDLWQRSLNWTGQSI
jgi:NAD(P)-dependent dehydrogenase (short-subunit alcohol dehydrogenase family)